MEDTRDLVMPVLFAAEQDTPMAIDLGAAADLGLDPITLFEFVALRQYFTRGLRWWLQMPGSQN